MNLNYDPTTIYTDDNIPLNNSIDALIKTIKEYDKDDNTNIDLVNNNNIIVLRLETESFYFKNKVVLENIKTEDDGLYWVDNFEKIINDIKKDENISKAIKSIDGSNKNAQLRYINTVADPLNKNNRLFSYLNAMHPNPIIDIMRRSSAEERQIFINMQTNHDLKDEFKSEYFTSLYYNFINNIILGYGINSIKDFEIFSLRHYMFNSCCEFYNTSIKIEASIEDSDYYIYTVSGENLLYYIKIVQVFNKNILINEVLNSISKVLQNKSGEQMNDIIFIEDLKAKYIANYNNIKTTAYGSSPTEALLTNKQDIKTYNRIKYASKIDVDEYITNIK